MKKEGVAPPTAICQEKNKTKKGKGNDKVIGVSESED